MNCNYKVKITDIQTKYKFKVFCTGYDDSEIKEKIDTMYEAWPKASGEGETVTLDNTANATMSIDLKGNTSQAASILPSEYTQVDYIESSGTQYIDTGVAPSTSTGIDITYIDNNQDSGTDTLIGSGTSSNEGYYGLSRNGTQLQLYWGSTIRITNYTFTFGERHNIKFNLNSDRTLYIDDVAKWTVSSPSSAITSNTMTLFAFKYTSIVQYADAIKLYSCKIYDGANLVRDYVPCYRNSDNEVGIYDLVNNVFYTNAGTGAFTYGAIATLPNPNFPISINVVSGDNSINVCGKNLLQLINFSANNQKTYTHNNVTATLNDDGTITLNGTASGNTDFYLTNNNVNSTNKKMILFAIDGTFTGNTSAYCYTVENQNGKYVTLSAIGNGEVNLVENKTYISFEIYAKNGNVYNNARFGIMVVDKNLTINTYEPYTGTTYPISLGTLELCKIGDYQDYFYKDSSKWYIHKEIGKVVLDGSESDWGNDGGSAPYSIYKRDVFRKNDLSVVLSNNFMGVSYSSNWNLYNYLITANTTANQIPAIRIKYDTNALTLDEFKTWLSTHNTIVYYILATATTTEITDTTLISQLEALRNAESYEGQTNISQANNDKSFIITAKALKDLSNLGTSTVSTLNTANVNRSVFNQSIDPVNLEMNSEDLELNNEEEIIEETPEER